MNLSGRNSTFLYFIVGRNLRTALVKMVHEVMCGEEGGGGGGEGHGTREFSYYLKKKKYQL